MTQAKSHPHPGRTVAQRRALDAIGCGNNSPIMATATRDALLASGLIVHLGDDVVGGRGIGVRVAVYEMPIPVHMQWCNAVADEDEPDA